MSYADEVEYASRNLIELTMREEEQLKKLRGELSNERARANYYQWDFETSDMNDDFSDSYVMAAFGKMAKAKLEEEKLAAAEASLAASIGAKQVAVQAMCGALLQIVKQGISLVHGSLNSSPDGRSLGGISLKEIVWQARNQAIHYEDQSFHNNVVTLFARLEQAFGAEFALSQHAGQSRAKQVVSLLGWTDYSSLQSDMKLLGL